VNQGAGDRGRTTHSLRAVGARSGAARMQEGILALMQLPGAPRSDVCSALAKGRQSLISCCRPIRPPAGVDRLLTAFWLRPIAQSPARSSASRPARDSTDPSREASRGGCQGKGRRKKERWKGEKEKREERGKKRGEGGKGGGGGGKGGGGKGRKRGKGGRGRWGGEERKEKGEGGGGVGEGEKERGRGKGRMEGKKKKEERGGGGGGG